MKKFGTYEIQCRDALDALPDLQRCSVHAVVTDPPFGLVEFTSEQLAKLRSGKGGIWEATAKVRWLPSVNLPRDSLC